MNRTFRPLVDAVMLGLVLTLMSHTYLSGGLHEAFGLALLAVVAVHLRLSIRKARRIRSGPFSWFRFACRLVEISLAVNLLLLAVTGLSLARGLFALTDTPIRPSLARPLHRVLAHAGLLLVGLHLGLRLPGFLAFVAFRRKKPTSGWFPRLFVYPACGLAAYGLIAAIRRDYFRIDLASNLMMFANPEEPFAAFLLDHAAILALAIATGVLLRRFIRTIETLNRNEG